MPGSPESRGNGQYGPWQGPVCDPFWSANDSQRHRAPLQLLENFDASYPDADDEHVEGDERYDDLRPPTPSDGADPKPTGIEPRMAIDWMQDGTFTRFNDIDESEA